MDLGRIVGTVVCTIKDPLLDGIRLLLVEPINQSLEVTGRPFVAADAVGAGYGQIVYYETAREAPFAFKSQPPVDAAIIGIVDRLDLVATFPDQAS
jgi:microcompartment protein CcmK/EutM